MSATAQRAGSAVRPGAAVALVLAPWCLGACATAALGLRPAPATLVIECDRPAALELLAVQGDELVPLLRQAPTSHRSVSLLPGAYVLRATWPDATQSVLPAPLLEAALPLDRTVHLRVAAPPAGAAADPDFAWVPAGPTMIGDTLGLGQEDERPPRIVDLPAFWLARRECTNAEFAAFLNAVEPAVDPGWCAFDSRKCRLLRDGATGRWSTPAPDLPVVTVSLAGARAFCAWRTRETGRRHRLPTEAEWEKAARGPASFVFAYGNVYRRAAANQESGELRAVGLFAASGFGLFDLTGNAFEWTADAYGRDPAPQQVLRGGSFVLDGMYLRNSFRMWQRPDVRADDIGFRVARDAVAADQTHTDSR